jgi:fructokinase
MIKMKCLENQKVNIGIEIGGTNIKIAIVNEELSMSQIIQSIPINSLMVKDFLTHSDPEMTIKEICKWVIEENMINSDLINSVGISMFGPLNLTKLLESYGTVLNTPKPGWKDFNVVDSFAKNLKIDKKIIIIELDVNCAAFLEHKVGIHK